MEYQSNYLIEIIDCERKRERANKKEKRKEMLNLFYYNPISSTKLPFNSNSRKPNIPLKVIEPPTNSHYAFVFFKISK